MKYIKLAIGLIFVIILSGFILTLVNNKSLKESINVYDNNFKALMIEKDSLQNKVLAYRFDVEQLEYINDSIINKLNNTRKELNIKDKQLLQMQYLLSESNTKDTITLKDTIFRDNFIGIDTTLGDEWYKVKLKLEYPNTIIHEGTYRSELQVFAKSSKEIVGTPKKCALARLFQRKYKVVRVDIVDNNPHSEIKNQTFVITE